MADNHHLLAGGACVGGVTWGEEEHLYVNLGGEEADVSPALLLGGFPAVVPAAPIVPQVVFPAIVARNTSDTSTEFLETSDHV
jgi:hypothetical protein